MKRFILIALAAALACVQPVAAAGMRLKEIEGDWRPDRPDTNCRTGLLIRFTAATLPDKGDPQVTAALIGGRAGYVEDVFTAAGQDVVTVKWGSEGPGMVLRRRQDGRIGMGASALAASEATRQIVFVRCPSDAELQAQATGAMKPSDIDFLLGSWAGSPTKHQFSSSCDDAVAYRDPAGGGQASFKGEFRVFRGASGKLYVARSGGIGYPVATVREATVRPHLYTDTAIPIQPAPSSALVVTEDGGSLADTVFYAARVGDKVMWWERAWIPSRQGRAFVRCGD